MTFFTVSTTLRAAAFLLAALDELVTKACRHMQTGRTNFIDVQYAVKTRVGLAIALMCMSVKPYFLNLELSTTEGFLSR